LVYFFFIYHMEKEASRYAYLKVPGMLSHTQSDNSFT